jgi:hypothetical protein
MRVDRHSRCVLTVIAIALGLIAVRPWIDDLRSALRPGPAEAQTGPKYEVSVPKAWGKLVGYSNNNLLLESSDGALRIVDVEGRAPEYPKVKVLVRWQP